MKHVKNYAELANPNRVTKYIKELSDLELKCRMSHSRDWAIPYLARVYQLDMNWKMKKLSRQRREDLNSAAFGARSIRKDKKSIHLIIECTSKVNTRTRNRWASALLNARVNNIEPEKIATFLLKENKGGLAGRAAEYAEHRKAKNEEKATKHRRTTKSPLSKVTSTNKRDDKANRVTRDDNDDWG